jgi:hypothetical protein
MEKQYYVPTNEEFHVGFEFEMNGKSLEKPQEGWVEMIFGNPYIHLLDYKKNALETFARVKFLDREDIESLDWEVIKEPYRWQFKHKSGRYRLTTDTYTKEGPFPIPHPNSGCIRIIDDRDGDEYTIFYGYIKNKSELKRLMKQLDILNFLSTTNE